MATVAIDTDRLETMADVVKRLGNIPLKRILSKPAPGTATERDLIALLDALNKRICELVDGVLVEKAMGTREALLAGILGHFVWNYLEKRDLGVVIPGDGPFRLRIGLVRIPDLSFVSWDRMPGGEFPDDAIAGIVPDLAVEVISKSNTPKEIDRKLKEYFKAGVRLTWVIEPLTETVRVHTAPDKFERLDNEDTLRGKDILPGFSLPLKNLFGRAQKRRRKTR
jgi:Uma2 family endonuclease